MSNPGRALFAVLLVILIVIFITYYSSSTVIDTKKNTYNEAIKAASQTAVLNMLDTTDINSLYDGSRRDLADIPITYDSLDKFRTDLSRLLETGKSGRLEGVSNINIPLVGYITYENIFGVTFGQSYSDRDALANQEDDMNTVSEYLDSGLTDRYQRNKNNRGTYLLPMGYTYYVDKGAGLDKLEEKLWRFTLGEIVYITDVTNMTDTMYTIYHGGCNKAEHNGDKLESGHSYLHLVNSNDFQYSDEAPSSGMPIFIDITEYLNKLGFNTLEQLRDYIVMSTINNYLTNYSGVGFNNTTGNINQSLKFDLSLSDHSSNKKDYTRGSTVIDGPGMFAIVDIYQGDTENSRTYQRIASFGSSELVRTSANANRGSSSGSIGDGTGGNPGGGDPDVRPSDKPTEPSAPQNITVTISFKGNGGIGSMPQQKYTIQDGKTQPVVIPNCNYTAPAGYKFMCWATSLNPDDKGRAEYYPNQTIQLNTKVKDITLYAIWEKDKDIYHKITYYSDGNKVFESDEVMEGEEVTIQNIGGDIRVIDGQIYKFHGWSESSDATTVEYKAGDKIVLNIDLDLYAVWQPQSKLVIYASNVEAVYDGKSHPVIATTSVEGAEISILYRNTNGDILDSPPIEVGTYTATITAEYEGQVETKEVKIIISREYIDIKIEAPDEVTLVNKTFEDSYNANVSIEYKVIVENTSSNRIESVQLNLKIGNPYILTNEADWDRSYTSDGAFYDWSNDTIIGLRAGEKIIITIKPKINQYNVIASATETSIRADVSATINGRQYSNSKITKIINPYPLEIGPVYSFKVKPLEEFTVDIDFYNNTDSILDRLYIDITDIMCADVIIDGMAQYKPVITLREISEVQPINDEQEFSGECKGMSTGEDGSTVIVISGIAAKSSGRVTLTFGAHGFSEDAPVGSQYLIDNVYVKTIINNTRYVSNAIRIQIIKE